MGIAIVALRFFEFPAIQFTWRTNAWASTFWTILVMHTIHCIAGMGENLVFTALLLRGRFEEKEWADLEANGVYWMFIVLSWIPLFSLMFLERVLFPK
jgi:cytochrome c oxidase subunit III